MAVLVTLTCCRSCRRKTDDFWKFDSYVNFVILQCVASKPSNEVIRMQNWVYSICVSIFFGPVLRFTTGNHVLGGTIHFKFSSLSVCGNSWRKLLRICGPDGILCYSPCSRSYLKTKLKIFCSVPKNRLCSKWTTMNLYNELSWMKQNLLGRMLPLIVIFGVFICAVFS